MNQLKQINDGLRLVASFEYADVAQRFFKTGPGEYGEGDIFLGVRMPDLRNVARKYRSLPLGEVERLLTSKYHEERMTALVIMDLQYQKADETGQKKLKNAYIRGMKHINNWDLVDISAPKIIGRWMADHPEDRPVLYKMAKSSNLWRRRVSILATFELIRLNQLEDTLRLANILLDDEHDLMHKAVGWMLREVGKRDFAVEEKFLKGKSNGKVRYKQMPRTMLRYAIERFPESKRQRYLKGGI